MIGAPTDSQVIAIASPPEIPASNVSGPYAPIRGGKFTIERIPEGEYNVLAQAVGNLKSSRVESKKVTVRAGATTRVELEIARSGANLEIAVFDPADHPHPGVQVLLLPGALDVSSIDELNAQLASRLDELQTVWMPPNPAVVSSVTPGDYTLCVIPTPFDPKDPRMKKVEDSTLPVDCAPLKVTGDDKITRHVRRAPPPTE